jgi:hypothetical protein
MKKILLALIIAVFVVSSCRKNNSVEILSETISFNSNLALNLDSVINFTKYILLEDSEKSLFRDAHKVLIKENKIFILDIISKSVLIFNTDGTFINKVGNIGQGPGEFTNPTDFDIDLDGNVFIYNGAKKEILKYNTQGLFMKSLKTPFDIDNFSILPNGRFLFALARYNSRECKNYQFAVTDSLLNIESCDILYDDNYDPNYILETFMQKSQDGIMYYKPVGDIAYLFSEVGLEKKIGFDMGTKRVPEQLRKDLGKLKRMSDTSYEFVINTPILIKNYLVGTMIQQNVITFFMYDIKTKSMYQEQQSKILPVSYVNESTFLSIINAVVYPDYFLDKELTSEQKRYLENGGTILCLHTII